MSVLAIQTIPAVLAWLGLAAGLGVLGLVVSLFYRVLRPAQEIRRYGEHIETAATAIKDNVDGLDEFGRTRDLAVALPDLARGYLASRRQAS